MHKTCSGGILNNPVEVSFEALMGQVGAYIDQFHLQIQL
jgi:hypothetical protein